MIGLMDNQQQPWGAGWRAGAVLLAVLAAGLGFIAADILIGQRFFRKGCCQDTEPQGEPVEQ